MSNFAPTNEEIATVNSMMTFRTCAGIRGTMVMKFIQFMDKVCSPEAAVHGFLQINFVLKTSQY